MSTATQGLIRTARRTVVQNVTRIGPKTEVNSVNTTVRSCTRTGKFSIIQSVIKRNVNERVRARLRVPRCNRQNDKLGLQPKVIFAIRPVLGRKATALGFLTSH